MASQSVKDTGKKRVTITVEIRDEGTGELRSHEQTVMVPLAEDEAIELAYVSTIDHTKVPRIIRGVP